MNLFRKIGNIFTKMTSSRKADKIAEKLVQPERVKVEPVRDIEDIVKGTRSPFFSPVQTRNQRLTKKSVIKAIPSLVNETVVAPNVPSKPVQAKKPIKTNVLDDLKMLPKKNEILMHEQPVTSIEVAEIKAEASIGELTKPARGRPKKKQDSSATLKPMKDPKKSPKVVKVKELIGSSPNTSMEDEAVQPEPLSPVVVKGKRKSKDSPKPSEEKLEKWEPNQWSTVLENIKLMRATTEAPVDTMGCHKCSDQNADAKTQRFHILLALMLSSQTKDQVTFEAMKRLQENSCTPTNVAEMDVQKLETLLYPVSFYKNKAKYIKSTSQILVDQYESDIPNNVKELVKLPGVGPKMAHICMSSAWNIVTGIGVDVHVHRISNRLGWVRSETKEPEQTRKELEAWLPSDRWKEVNYLLVGFGQTICTPTKPKCSDCLNKGICPSANVLKSVKLKKQKAAC